MFEANKNVVLQENLDIIDRLKDHAEAQQRNFQHPDPYFVPGVEDDESVGTLAVNSVSAGCKDDRIISRSNHQESIVSLEQT